jgi:hypothetical protein
MRRFNKITAIILILIFFQKSGFELYLHNWLHQNKNHASSTLSSHALSTTQPKCSCIEDALRPLTASTGIIEIKIPEKYFSSFFNCYYSSISSVIKIFYGLRGPPAKAV